MKSTSRCSEVESPYAVRQATTKNKTRSAEPKQSILLARSQSQNCDRKVVAQYQDAVDAFVKNNEHYRALMDYQATRSQIGRVNFKLSFRKIEEDSLPHIRIQKQDRKLSQVSDRDRRSVSVSAMQKTTPSVKRRYFESDRVSNDQLVQTEPRVNEHRVNR
jgi:hypothetical protein